MKEDFKNYKELNKRGDVSFSSYFLLKILYSCPKFYEEIERIEDMEFISSCLLDLENEELIRIMEDEQVVLTVKAKRLFESRSEVDDVIDLFNQLKSKYLNINRASQCKAERPAINQRIKEYGVDIVKAVIQLKFDKWSREPQMRHYLGSMATLIKANSFDGFVNQLEMEKVTETNRNTML